MKRPRVAIDVSPAVLQGAGIARYVDRLVDALAAMDDGPELAPYSTAGPPGAVPWPGVAAARRLPYGPRAWRALTLLSHGSGIPLPGWPPPCDVVHATDIVSPLAVRVPTVMTVHDLSFLIFPEHHTVLNRANLAFVTPRAARRASRVIADSQATARDLTSRCAVPAAKIRVIYPACDHERFHPMPDEHSAPTLTRLGLRRPYILFVGTWEPRKNLIALLESFAALAAEGVPHRLVLAGATGWKHHAAERRLRELGLEERVDRPGRVPDADLATLYRAASVFVYPSLYEGFGLPPLEALACGVPVVTSNVSSLPEVVGEAALSVSPGDIGALTGAIRAALTSAEVRARLAAEGPRRAAAFTWTKTARETAAVYREAVAGP